MRNHLLTLLAVCVLSTYSQAQRYESEIFTNVSVATDIVYGQNYSVLTGTPMLEDLKMDIYTPDGDTVDERYLIIMAHAGSFLPKGTNTLPFGNKSDSTIVEMCTQFAKRGWTAASISYRLGWNPTPDVLGGDQETRASTIIQAVYRSMQDMKTAVRFFRKDYDTGGNTYKIDPDHIAVGGSNSGGYTAVACGTLDKTSELNLAKLLTTGGIPYVVPDTLGDFDGFGGSSALNNDNHTGYESDIQLVLNLAGAVGDSSWIEGGEAPIVNFHGVADALTPYKTATVIVAATGDAIIEVSGSYVIAKEASTDGNTTVWDTAGFSDAYTTRAQALSSYEGLYPFTGASNGFEPWAWYDPTDPNIADSVEIAPGVKVPGSGFGSAANPFATKAKALGYIDTIMGYFSPRALAVMEAITDPVGLKRSDDPRGVKLYPNPSNGQFYVVSTSADPILGYELRDVNGRIVANSDQFLDTGFELSIPELQTGIYFLETKFKEYSSVERVVIE